MADKTVEMQINLKVKMPRLMGLRMKISIALIRAAAYVMGGKLEVEFQPEIKIVN